MRIKKIGHCCLVIEEKGRRIMTDPGSWTVNEQEKEGKIDIIIITHEHGDHVHVESLKNILIKNPQARIITNGGVGKLLDGVGIKYEILVDKTPTDILGIEIEAHDCKHEEIFQDKFLVENTAFFIDERLFYPGDAFYNPGRRVEILALPIAGPWANVKDSINYTLKVNPKICFPVHDGMLKQFGANHKIPKLVFQEKNISFVDFENKDEYEF